MMRCDEGKCILESLMCNDEDDCVDGTDEPSTCGELRVAAGHCLCGWGLGEPQSCPALCHPSAVSLQVGAASYATGAVQRHALTRTGECSAPVGPAGCCRPMGRTVLVRRGQGVHTLGMCSLGCQKQGLPGAGACMGMPGSALLLPACHTWPHKGCV